MLFAASFAPELSLTLLCDDCLKSSSVSRPLLVPTSGRLPQPAPSVTALVPLQSTKIFYVLLCYTQAKGTIREQDSSFLSVYPYFPTFTLPSCFRLGAGAPGCGEKLFTCLRAPALQSRDMSQGLLSWLASVISVSLLPPLTPWTETIGWFWSLVLFLFSFLAIRQTLKSGINIKATNLIRELRMPFLAFYRLNLEASTQLQRSSKSALKLTSEQRVLWVIPVYSP